MVAGGNQTGGAGGNGLIPAAAWAPGPDGSPPTTAILIDGKVPDVRNSRVTKLDSRADLVERAARA